MEGSLKRLFMNGVFFLIILIIIGIEYMYRRKHKIKLENKQYKDWFSQSEEKLNYLRIIYVMTLQEDNKVIGRTIPWLGETVAVVLAGLVIWLGVFPQPLMVYIGAFF